MTKNAKPSFHSQVKTYRMMFSLLLKVREHVDGQHDLTELDMIEAFKIVEGVALSRLSTNPKEWKGDDKNNYQRLFLSIKTEALEAIQDYFTAGGEKCRGYASSKFNTLIIDSIFDILQSAGPERAPSVVKKLCAAGIRDIKNKESVHEDDAKVAQSLLTKFSQQRSRKNKKPLNKKQRLAAIRRITESIQTA